MNPTNDLELFNIFGTSLKAGKTKVTSKLCFYEACEAVVLEKEANVQILRNGIQDFARGRRVPQKSPFVLIFFFFGLTYESNLRQLRSDGDAIEQNKFFIFWLARLEHVHGPNDILIV